MKALQGRCQGLGLGALASGFVTKLLNCRLRRVSTDTEWSKPPGLRSRGTKMAGSIPAKSKLADNL